MCTIWWGLHVCADSRCNIWTINLKKHLPTQWHTLGPTSTVLLTFAASSTTKIRVESVCVCGGGGGGTGYGGGGTPLQVNQCVTHILAKIL